LNIPILDFALCLEFGASDLESRARMKREQDSRFRVDDGLTGRGEAPGFLAAFG
jgi:hypothetical protein